MSSIIDPASLVKNYSRDALFDEGGMRRLRESYLREDETSPQDRFAYVSAAFGSNQAHAQRLYDYSSQHWLSYATPVLAYGRGKNALPISCFLSSLSDSAAGLVDTYAEVSWLSMMGGGIGIGVGIRGSDSKSTGVMAHLKTYDVGSLAYRQSTTRRGSYAAYLDINHPDIIPFLQMRKPTGDQNIRCLNLHHGVNITDDFMQIIERCMVDPAADDSWELKEPHSGEVREVVSAKALWSEILDLRISTGEPYLHFIDASNRALPQFQKDLGLRVRQSNLCQEIVLPTDEKRTAVCCLSSVNLEHYDAWSKEPQFLHDVAGMLDNVLTVFIEKAPDTIARARYSATRERAIGVGALGFHAYLQSKCIPFESAGAVGINKRVFRHIREGLDAANLALAAERGPCPDSLYSATPVRFSHMMALAPNASTSILMGNTSPSIEPYRANAYRQDTLSGASFNVNRHLKELLAQKGLDTDEVWSSIMSNDGSVEHLSGLTDWERAVFKTSMEIDQMWIIQHAADRQKFIDQGQSLNLFFTPNVSISQLHAAHFTAWKSGLKGLYYCRSEKVLKADKVGKSVKREIHEEINMAALVSGDTCLACEG